MHEFDASNASCSWYRCTMSISVAVPPQLEIKDLRVVLAVARCGTTAAAGGELHLTQSAVSRALAVAEERAGVALFTRTAKGLVPTDAGARAVELAPDVLASLGALERAVRAPTIRPPRIRFAAECFMAYPWVARMVGRLRGRGLAVELCVSSTHRATEALAAGDLDAAMLLGRTPEGCASLPLLEDELVFVVGKAHPLAAEPHLLPRHIASHRLFVPTATASDAWFLRKVFGARRPALRVERIPITEAIVELSRAGEGLGVLSGWVAGAYLDEGSGLTIKRLRKGSLQRTWSLSFRPDLGPIGDELASALVAASPGRSAGA